ncbi:MAG: hypothetical protein ABR986_05465 [Methanomassiliicoccales archaeon]
MLMANVLKTVPEGEQITINEMHEATGIHYSTLQSYLELISYAQSRMPRTEYVKGKNGLAILVVEKKNGISTELDNLIIRLFDAGALRKTKAIMTNIQRSTIDLAISSGYIEESSGKIFLTSDGTIKGVELAERREEESITPIASQFANEEKKPCLEHVEAEIVEPTKGFNWCRSGRDISSPIPTYEKTIAI